MELSATLAVEPGSTLEPCRVLELTTPEVPTDETGWIELVNVFDRNVDVSHSRSLSVLVVG